MGQVVRSTILSIIEMKLTFTLTCFFTISDFNKFHSAFNFCWSNNYESFLHKICKISKTKILYQFPIIYEVIQLHKILPFFVAVFVKNIKFFNK